MLGFTITFFTWSRALELRHVIALRMTLVAVRDAIDTAHGFKNGGTVADAGVYKIYVRIPNEIILADFLGLSLSSSRLHSHSTDRGW